MSTAGLSAQTSLDCASALKDRECQGCFLLHLYVDRSSLIGIESGQRKPEPQVVLGECFSLSKHLVSSDTASISEQLA
jgi:hypothetical protein